MPNKLSVNSGCFAHGAKCPCSFIFPTLSSFIASFDNLLGNAVYVDAEEMKAPDLGNRTRIKGVLHEVGRINEFRRGVDA